MEVLRTAAPLSSRCSTSSRCSPSAPSPSTHRPRKTIWVGTGEAWTRNSTSIGDGIYKSTDGGDNWTNLGLKNSERIAKILIDPKDGNTVYACVPGKLWSDSDDRGLYKTTDGGKTWTKILKGANLSTGCSMISMSSRDPKVIYAGMWDFRRKGWTFRSGGDTPTAPSGSGLFETTDGGATWTSSTRRHGLPPKPWGRIAVTAAPSNPNVVYALIESPSSALYRSDDGGKTWQRARPQPDDGVASVLLRQPDRRSQGRKQGLQARRRPDPEQRRRQELQRNLRRRARRLSRRLDRSATTPNT